MAKKKVLFHQDSAQVYTSVIAMVKIIESKLKLLPRAPDLRDLALSDYFIFLNLTKRLADQRFPNNEEMKSAVNGYFEEVDGSNYNQGIEAIERR